MINDSELISEETKFTAIIMAIIALYYSDSWKWWVGR